MGETTNQIEAQIESARDNLGSNFIELERKVKSVTDWKQHFQTKPMTMLGMSFGAGILLATMMGGRRSRRTERRLSASESHVGTENQKHKAIEAWDNIKGALLGVAATRFKDFVGEVVPGFHEQFHRTEEKAKTVSPTL